MRQKRPTTELEKRVAITMCEADGFMPYERTISNANEAGNDTAVYCERWQNYIDHARRFIAGFQALGMNF